MMPISIDGYKTPPRSSTGAVPMLRWVEIADLLVDPTYQRPVSQKGHRQIEHIARNFAWSCFAPVIVSPVKGGKFAIIDGQHRTTAAALIGIESIPCQIVIVSLEEQAVAFKAINAVTTPVSRMVLHAAAVIAGDKLAGEVAEIASCANVELLRCPISMDKQQAGQTFAIGVIYKCLERHGRDVVITALQCITQTSNNKPGALTGRTIKAICNVLGENREWRDAGLKLLEAFDNINLDEIHRLSAIEAVSKGSTREGVIAERVKSRLQASLASKTVSVDVICNEPVNISKPRFRLNAKSDISHLQ